MSSMEATLQKKGFQTLTDDEKMHTETGDDSKEWQKVKLSYSETLLHRRGYILVSLALLLLAGLGLGITFALAASSRCTNKLGVDYAYPLSYDRSLIPADALNKTYNILLFGDSLINYSFELFGLSEKMSAYLPDFNLVIENYGVDSSRIVDMRRRVQPMLDETSDTYAVFLFWDSDVSDVNEYGTVPLDDINRVRDAYKMNVDFVLKAIKKKKPEAFIALAGPEMLGEGPLFSPVLAGTYYGKLKMIQRYIKINQEISEKNTVPYINMNRAFRSAIPAHYYGYYGCVTTDGEHPNDNGATIIAKMFTETLLEQIMQ